MGVRMPYRWFPARTHGYENNRANQLLTFKAFANRPGVANLDSDLTINSSTVSASYVYNGKDATSTNWVPRVGGATLALQAGTAPTYNNGSPLLGSDDDSVKFNGGGYYKDASNTACQIGTEDFVIEVVWKNLDHTEVLCSTIVTNGYYLYTGTAGTGSVSFYINDDDGNVTIFGASSCAPAGTWNHGIIFLNRDEASTNGSQWYVNGVASGSGVDVSGTAKTLLSSAFTIGAYTNGSLNFNSNLAYCAMWKQADWMQAGAAGPAEWETIAKERFIKLTGFYPQVAAGTAMPTASTRAFPAYLDKVEGSTRKLYQVGSEWLRCCSRVDGNGRTLYGYLPEPQVQNLAIQSGDVSTTWTKLNAGDSFALNSVNAPNDELVMDGIIADATDTEHGITQNVTLSATSTAISCFAKKGDKNWVCIEDSTIANCKAFFDVDNGVVGATPGAGIDYLYIEPTYKNDTVRCIAIVTGTVAAHAIKFKIANADNDDDFSGDGATVNGYLWGFQVECNGLGYATSYIPTTTAAATRLKDQLTYVAGDNIGGEDVGQGTIAMDVLYPSYDLIASRYLWSISDGGSSADMIAGTINATGDVFTAISAASGGNAGSAAVAGDIVNGVVNKLSVLAKTNSLNGYVNSVQGTEDTSCDMPDDLDTIHIGMKEDASLQASALISNIRIYKEPTTGG